MEISVTDFSAPIEASVFKFCIHLQEGKMYNVNGNEDANPHFAFFFSNFHFFLLSLFYCVTKEQSHIAYQTLYLFIFLSFQWTFLSFFFVKDFSATTWVRILKFGTKLDGDELYCVTKDQPHIAYQSLFIHFSFSPMEISVTDVSAPIGASVFKFCIHLQEGKVYGVNEN